MSKKKKKNSYQMKNKMKKVFLAKWRIQLITAKNKKQVPLKKKKICEG